uniref:Uncharacterized protein n=1 Tax=Megaviridae environmental sample TaxID=1737588 RepID=A0A5J6VMZ8_9VIRU|nr:MAG: hypothetical protein [Megaviridae environmental sample]
MGRTKKRRPYNTTKKRIVKKRQSHKQKHMRHKTKKNKSKGFLNRLFGRRSRKDSEDLLNAQRELFLARMDASAANENVIKDLNLDKSLSPTPPVDKSTFNPYLHDRLKNQMKKLHEERRQRKKSATRKYNKRKQSSHRKSTLRNVRRLTSLDVKKMKDEINDLAEKRDRGIDELAKKVREYKRLKISKRAEDKRKVVHLKSQLKTYYHHPNVQALNEQLMEKYSMRKPRTSTPQKEKKIKSVIHEIYKIVVKPNPVKRTHSFEDMNTRLDLIG